MFNRYHNSWQLVKASWAVLRSDKQLLLFPIISAATMVLITIVFLIPVGAIFGLVGALTNSRGQSGSEVIGYAVLFLFYLVSYTVSIFFNVALVGAAMIRLDGGSPTLRDGLSLARSKFGIILQYAVISATVGIIFRFIEEKLGFLGSIIAWLGGLAWNVATYRVVPVLAAKDVSPIDAIKESANLLKKTWGEQIIADSGMGFVFFLLSMLVIFVGMFLTFAVGAAANSPALVVFFILATFVAVIGLAVIAGALSGIYQAALYRYAETGVVPDNFDIEMIKGAFKEKKKKNH
jgi:hypothetical protein